MPILFVFAAGALLGSAGTFAFSSASKNLTWLIVAALLLAIVAKFLGVV